MTPTPTATANGTAKANGAPPATAPPRRPVAPVRSRRRGLLPLGLLIVLVGLLAGTALYRSAGARRPVVAVARPVAAGQVLAAADLTEARVSVDPSLAPVPAERSAAVVGRSAAVALLPGTLLTDGHLATGPLVAPDQAVMAAALRPGQFPADLRVGDRVVVVPGSQGTTTGEPGGSTFAPTPATVFGLEPAGQASDALVASLQLPLDAATGLADEGAAGRLAVVLLGGQR